MKYIQNFGDPDLKFKDHDFEREPEPGDDDFEIPPTPPEKTKFRWKINRWAVLGIVILISAVMVISVAQVINTNAQLKEIEMLEKNYQHRREDNEILIKQINYLESPERITSIARLKFGLEVPYTVPQIVNQ